MRAIIAIWTTVKELLPFNIVEKPFWETQQTFDTQYKVGNLHFLPPLPVFPD